MSVRISVTENGPWPPEQPMTAQQIEETYKVSTRFVRMALRTLRPPYSSAGGHWASRFYAPEHVTRIVTWIDRAYALQHARAEFGGGLEYMRRTKLAGLDGQVRTYIPLADAVSRLTLGGYGPVEEACSTYWTRVMLETLTRDEAIRELRAQTDGTSIDESAMVPHVDYKPRAYELPCVRFSSTRHASIWVREDALPSFQRHVQEQRRGRPPFVRASAQ